MAEWIDLIDPTPEELRERLPREIYESALEQLLAPAEHEDEPRPTLQGHGDYVFGVFLVAVAVPDEDRIFYQEVDVVVTHDVLVTVSKTPPGEHFYDPDRKSTRLNSSHLVISYAVFCLKKKKVTHIPERVLDPHGTTTSLSRDILDDEYAQLRLY